MKKFGIIYNLKTSNFMTEAKTVNEVINSGNFYTVCDNLEADSLDQVFYICNNNHPEQLKNVVKRIAKLDPSHTKFPSIHTSMSCGDVVKDFETGKYYACAAFGWKELS